MNIKEDKANMLNDLIRIYKNNYGMETNDISDGYHTFGELYEHRITLWIALCRGVASICWKSTVHSDGSIWDGWFLLGINREKGSQMTYHLPMSKWEECEFATEIPIAPEFDGHTSKDVLERIKNI